MKYTFIPKKHNIIKIDNADQGSDSHPCDHIFQSEDPRPNATPNTTPNPYESDILLACKPHCEAFFKKAIAFVLQHEGGYSNHVKDAGGETNYGISKRAYPHLNIKDLTLGQAQAIYQQDYWDDIFLCHVQSLPLAAKLFDFCVYMGKAAGLLLLQKSLQQIMAETIFAHCPHTLLPKDLILPPWAKNFVYHHHTPFHKRGHYLDLLNDHTTALQHHLKIFTHLSSLQKNWFIAIQYANKFCPLCLVGCVICHGKMRLESIAKNRVANTVFLKGWLRRANNMNIPDVDGF